MLPVMRPETGIATSTGSYGPDDYWQRLEPDTDFRKKCRMTWAALIKCVFEVDPLKCPNCGGMMKVISFIERHRTDVIEKILKHCGLWKETPPRAPPVEVFFSDQQPDALSLDYEFFESLAS
jgi:hypothetical protein